MSKESKGGNTGVKKSARAVNRKLLNAMRKDRRDSFDLRSWEQRYNHRQFILNRVGRDTDNLRKRYEDEDSVENQAASLYEQYKDAGIGWGACVQAVKTGWVSNLHIKWAPKLKEVREVQKSTGGFLPPKVKKNKK